MFNTLGGNHRGGMSPIMLGLMGLLAPNEIEQALGEERIQWLLEQTGMPRDQLLNGLSGELPQAIDKLTPDGRLPTDEELSRLQ